MTPLVIAKLIGEVGLPLAQQLIALFHSGNESVDAAKWAELAPLAAYRSGDSLAAGGIKIEGDNIVPA